MKLRRTNFTGPVALLFCSMATMVLAHSPFESTARGIMGDTLFEVQITVGMDGGNALLAGAPPAAFVNRTVGPGAVLPNDFAERWFVVASGGTPVTPTKVQVRTDGLEYDISVEYPRPAGGVLGVNALYVEKLPSSFKSSFVLTDENGNILGSRFLERDNHAFEMDVLPPVATTVVPNVSVAEKISGLQTSSVPDVKALVPATAPPLVATPKKVSPAPAPAPAPVLAFGDFLRLGVEHILTGYDHLLFLAGLLVACQRVKPMLAIITCFTVAHSVTLALATLNVVSVSQRIIEPLIAATIVFVGLENFRRRDDVKLRCGLALGFGSIHGFGFASALRAAGLAGSGAALAKPLFAFNLGVECGQLAVAAVFLPVLFLLWRWPWFGREGTRLISAVVVVLGGWWLLQRVIF